MAYGLVIGPRVNVGAVRRFDPGVTLHLDFLAPGPASGPRFALDFRRGRGWLRDEQAAGDYVGIVRQRPAVPGLTLALGFRDGVYAAAPYVRQPIGGLSLALGFRAGIYAAAPYSRRPAEGLTLALGFADGVFAG